MVIPEVGVSRGLTRRIAALLKLNFDTKLSRDPRPADMLKPSSMRTQEFKPAFKAVRIAQFQSFLVGFLQKGPPSVCRTLAGERPLGVAEIWRSSGGSLYRLSSKSAGLVLFLGARHQRSRRNPSQNPIK